MRFARHVKLVKLQWEGAPLAGVFFILILFLLLHQSFVSPPGVPIELPVANGLPGTQGPAVALSIDAAGQVYFFNQAVTAEELRAKLKTSLERYGRGLTLVVYQDQHLPAAELVRILEIAQQSGVGKVLMAARPSLTPNFPKGQNAP